MPLGWTTIFDGQGKTMYVDPDTRIATYINPLYGIAPVGYELKQTDTGRLFYVSRQDGSMTWQRPLAVHQLPAGWEAGKTADGKVLVNGSLPNLPTTHVLTRYYINHVTKSNTWAKPTMPANATNSHMVTSRSSVPTPTPLVPTLSQLNRNQVQNPPPQVYEKGLNTPTLHHTSLPNQPRSHIVQPAQFGQATGLNSPPIYQSTRANPAPQHQVHAQGRSPHPTHANSDASIPRQISITSPQFPAPPPRQPGATPNLPSSSTRATSHQPQRTTPSLSTPSYPTPSITRPPLQSRIFSAPATANARTTTSTMGSKFKDSMTAFTRNAGWQKAALGVGTIGTIAVKAALMDDFGSLDSAEYASFESATVPQFDDTAAVDGDTTSSPAAYDHYSSADIPTFESYSDSSAQAITGAESADAVATQDPGTQQQGSTSLEAQHLLQAEGRQNAVALI
ncbi:MAG: hypothetical protein Q9211_005412 [Gyalolechia sp. 1 TL-2023]